MTEPQPDPDAPRGLRSRLASWRIPPRLFGRVRTSTVLLGICFVLTALLYDQLRPDPQLPQQGPVPVDSSQLEQSVVPERSVQENFTTTRPPSATESAQPSGSQSATQTEVPGQAPGSVPTTTPQRTIIPGVPLPPQLESLVPTAPASPSGTP